MGNELSHFDEKTGRAKMVDVGHKQKTIRKAIARSEMIISAELADILSKGELKKGDAFTVAKTAGILAAKQTGLLIPMCHPIGLDCANIEIELIKEECKIRLESEVSIEAKTGIEMEALTAVTVAALTIYDMCKAVDKTIRIQKTGLYRKVGGKSGDFINPEMEW